VERIRFDSTTVPGHSRVLRQGPHQSRRWRYSGGITFHSCQHLDHYAHHLRHCHEIRQDKLLQKKYLPTRLIDVVAAVNLLKSLGPDDQLVKAVNELNILLNAETSMIVAQVNKRTFDIQNMMKEISITETQINVRTAEMQECMIKETTLVKALNDHTVEVQRSITESSVRGAESSQQLSVSMDRIEGISASSHTSIEELNKKVDAFLSRVECTSFPL
jgi:chaperonin cofactor prefoldin